MISVMIEKLEPKNCPACAPCVRKTWATSCQNTCASNEKVTFVCPFCGTEGSNIGARFSMKPLTCKKCFRNLSMLERMMDVLNPKLRIEFHKSC